MAVCPGAVRPLETNGDVSPRGGSDLGVRGGALAVSRGAGQSPAKKILTFLHSFLSSFTPFCPCAMCTGCLDGKCSGQLHRDMSKRPPGASWTEAKDAPPLLMLELDRESDNACGGAVLSSDTVQTLHVQVSRRTVQLQYRLAAALVMKPQHYATCLLDHESGQWIHYDGMLPWEGGDGVPRGRGSVIAPPRHAQDIGGDFWSVLLYDRVVAPDA